jgi:hypothetical protein
VRTTALSPQAKSTADPKVSAEKVFYMSKLAPVPAPTGSGRLGVLLAVFSIGLLLAGCAGSAKRSGGPGAGSTQPGSSESPRTSSAPPSSVAGGSAVAPCKQWSCVPEQPEQLGGSYSVRLWSSAAPTAVVAPDRSTPVLELLQDGQHRQWWVGQSGFGWAAKLDCRPAAATVPAHCAVLADVGSHAGSAEVVVLRAGLLISSPGTMVTFDGGQPVAGDLNHDGLLDVVGTVNDYQPSYATGHNYWVTYRYDGEELHRTGCLRQRRASEPPPDHLLTGTCPVVPQD